MKKRITGLFAATLLALSMMAVPAMAAPTQAPDCGEVVTLVEGNTSFLGHDFDGYCNY